MEVTSTRRKVLEVADFVVVCLVGVVVVAGIVLALPALFSPTEQGQNQIEYQCLSALPIEAKVLFVSFFMLLGVHTVLDYFIAVEKYNAGPGARQRLFLLLSTTTIAIAIMLRFLLPALGVVTWHGSFLLALVVAAPLALINYVVGIIAGAGLQVFSLGSGGTSEILGLIIMCIIGGFVFCLAAVYCGLMQIASSLLPTVLTVAALSSTDQMTSHTFNFAGLILLGFSFLTGLVMFLIDRARR